MPPFVLLFGIILVFTPMWAILQSVFTRRLRERYPEVIERLGTPRSAFDDSFLDMMRWLGFVFGRKYRLLGDKALKMQGDLLFVLIVVVLCSWIGVMIAPLKTLIAIPF